ncbi:Protein argonaute-2 [Halotydeus destructor]|nr:Protein argonaute-2 [Halotydeus destructor]
MAPVPGISVLSLAYNPMSELLENQAARTRQLSQLGGLSLSVGAKQLNSKKALEAMTKSRYVPRPGFGQDGDLLPVYGNHFPLEIVDKMVYHYDVDIEATRAISSESESIISRRGSGEAGLTSARKFRKINYQVNRQVMDRLTELHSKTCDQMFFKVLPVYDGLRNAYTKKQLVGDFPKRMFVTVADPAGDKSYAVTIKYVGHIDLSCITLYYKQLIPKIPEEVIQVLDIILRHGPNSKRIPVGKSLFVGSELSHRVGLGYGREVAFGYYQSVRSCMNGPNLVVDRATTAFYVDGPLVNFIGQLMNPGFYNGGRQFDEKRALSVPYLRDYDRKRIEKEVKTLQVTVNHLAYKRKYRINGLTHCPAREVMFAMKNKDGRQGAQVSVPEYFKAEYNIQLAYPNLPCIVVGMGQFRKFLPIEVCDLVPNQVIRRKLTNDQLASMIRTTTSQTPQQRFGVINDSVQCVMNDGKDYLAEFGIKVSNSPMVVDARVLDPPVLNYSGTESSVTPSNGVWYLEAKKQNLYQVSSHLESDWVLVNFAAHCTDAECERFIEGMRLKGEELGIRVSKPCKVARVQVYKPGMLENIFEKAKGCSKKLKIIVFIINGDESLYNEIKLVGDVQLGIPTQCITEKNIKKNNSATWSNLLLKINAKLGGINNILAASCPKPAILKKKGGLMVIGADVTHPSSDRSTVSSVAALVGSYDVDCTKYFASVRVQARNKQEVIKELDQMVVELLNKYQEENGKQLPAHIVIYRDGVSEGQFDQVLREEIEGLSTACDTVRPGYAPKLTMVIVQKRHHTRFVPVEDKKGKSKNIPPGTVIDTDVVHPTDFDFYLCSHFGVQGTSRPTHYHVLWDENKFSADELQRLTYYLCHVYAKCTRSISVPAPVQYAHLAAYRARVHIVGVFGSETASTDRNYRKESVNEKRDRESQLIASYNESTRVKSSLSRLMYFV